MSFEKLCKVLEGDIQRSYTEGVTVGEAEKLAGQFLHAQMQVSEHLKKVDLDAKMRKTGVKAVRAAIYMEAATKDPKKPSDVMLEAIVNLNDVVQAEQTSLDEAEVNRDNLERYYNIFRDAHVHFRTIARGKFD